MKTSIYEYGSYKEYLNDLVKNAPNKWGIKKKLASQINCQVSHITNVLSGNGHFSLEQAEASAKFFGLNFDETEYLLLLIQFNRSGTVSLKKFLEKILNERRRSFSALKSRLEIEDTLDIEYQSEYYSSWIFSAVHILTSISQYQTVVQIANKLQLPTEKTVKVLNFLVRAGLCKKESQYYKIMKPLLHLDKSSPLISKHHTNWRMKSILEIDKEKEENMHYSSIFSMSEKDFHHVKEIITQSLSKSLNIIKKSNEEECASLCIDLIKL